MKLRCNSSEVQKIGNFQVCGFFESEKVIKSGVKEIYERLLNRLLQVVSKPKYYKTFSNSQLTWVIISLGRLRITNKKAIKSLTKEVIKLKLK